MVKGPEGGRLTASTARVEPRSLAAVMVGWGALLLTATRPLLRRLSGSRPSSRDVAVTRVLGVREVAQGVVLAVAPRTAAVGGAVDALHAASMLLLAVLSRRHRRAALVSAAVAALLATASGRAARDVRR
jgi:hypothetical protein